VPPTRATLWRRLLCWKPLSEICCTLLFEPVAHQSRTIETSLTPELSEGTSVARERACTPTNMPAVPAIKARDIMGEELRVIKLRAWRCVSPTNLGGIYSDATRYSGESWFAQSVRRRITDITGYGGGSWLPNQMRYITDTTDVVEGCHGLPNHVQTRLEDSVSAQGANQGETITLTLWQHPCIHHQS
jgi:hypothetical protein